MHMYCNAVCSWKSSFLVLQFVEVQVSKLWTSDVKIPMTSFARKWLINRRIREGWYLKIAQKWLLKMFDLLVHFWISFDDHPSFIKSFKRQWRHWNFQVRNSKFANLYLLVKHKCSFEICFANMLPYFLPSLDMFKVNLIKWHVQIHPPSWWENLMSP